MEKLGDALKQSLETAQAAQTSGLITLPTNGDGVRKELMARLQSFSNTGNLSQEQRPESLTGEPHSRIGLTNSKAVAPEIPAKLAEEATTKQLPQSVQWWLEEMERHEKWAASVGGNPPGKPLLTEGERQKLNFEMAILEQILTPSHNKTAELAIEVSSFLSMFSFGLSHDESAKQLKLDGWCTELEHYPLYAIKRALGWWRRNGKKEPSFAEVLDDVKLFIGTNVLARKKLLEKLV